MTITSKIINQSNAKIIKIDDSWPRFASFCESHRFQVAVELNRFWYQAEELYKFFKDNHFENEFIFFIKHKIFKFGELDGIFYISEGDFHRLLQMIWSYSKLMNLRRWYLYELTRLGRMRIMIMAEK